MFAVNGLIIVGTGVLPSIRARLDLTTTQIAVLLFTAGVAGIARQIGGRLSDAIGARQVCLTALPVLVAAATTFAFATAYAAAWSARSCSVLVTAALTSP